MRGCKARQYSDQTRCLACKLVWDTNDPEPPPCGEEDKDKKDAPKIPLP